VQDPKLKYYLRAVQAAGGNVRSAYVQALENGTIKPEYRSQSPVQNIRSEAEEWIDLVGPGVDPNGNPLTREEAVIKRMQEIWNTKSAPLTKAGEQNLVDKVTSKGIDSLTPDELTEFGNTLPALRGSDIPTDDGARAGWIRDTDHVKVNGQVYKVGQEVKQDVVVNGVRYKLTWVEVESKDGQKAYIRSSGQMARTLQREGQMTQAQWEEWVNTLEKF
jgi:hypothetical protein